MSQDHAQAVEATIAAVGGWRAETLAHLRTLIRAADPEVVETVKWRKPSNPAGVPVWEHDGIVCTGGAFKGYVKLTFAHGAKIEDPKGVFNNGFGGNSMRAIDLREGETVEEAAFKALFQAAAAFNVAARARKER